jgi:DNA-binding GntR family transcriptional regulator
MWFGVILSNSLTAVVGSIPSAYIYFFGSNFGANAQHRGASVRKISKREVRDTFEGLEAITLLAIDKVAERFDEPHVKTALGESLEIALNFNADIAKREFVADYMEENVRFWGLLGALSNNPVLEEVRNRLQLPLLRLQTQGLVVNSHRSDWITMHHEILLALLEGDAKRARKFTILAQHDVLKAMLNLPNSAYLLC